MRKMEAAFEKIAGTRTPPLFLARMSIDELKAMIAKQQAQIEAHCSNRLQLSLRKSVGCNQWAQPAGFIDQGGTSREWVATYMGPSVGWVWLPNRNVLTIKTAGTYVLNLSTTRWALRVNVAGAVVIMFPTAIDPDVPAIAQPQSYAKRPITIVDIGGFALANPITRKCPPVSLRT